MTLPDFFAGLASMYPTSLPGKPAINYMQRRLDAESLSGEQVQRLYDRLCDSCQYHPTWEGVSAAIGELAFRVRRPRAGVHWLAFDHKGHAYVMRCPDPSHPPSAPRGATDVHLIIDNPVEDEPGSDPVPYQAPRREPVRSWFEPAGDLVLEIVEDISQSVSDRISHIDTWVDI